MNKVLMCLFIIVLVSGCIVIKEEEENKTSRPEINLSFDLEEEPEEQEPIEESATKPDLEITQIFWSTLFPDVDESDGLVFKVINNGNASVDGFNYKVTMFKGYDTWKEEIFEYEEVLGSEKSVTIREEFIFNVTGQFKTEVYLDWDNSIREQDEFNNYRQTPTLTVSGPETEETENESGAEEVNISLGKNKCIDSDGGINYNLKGRCLDDGPFILGMDDYCESNFKLVELYCANRTQRCKFAEPYECYCKNGACV